MNGRVLIFEPKMEGHRMEYLHHLHTYFTDSVERAVHCTLVVPHSFNFEMSDLVWSPCDRSEVIVMSEEETHLCATSGIRGYYNRYRVLKSYVKQTQAKHVFFISLMAFLPTILLGGGASLGGASVSGIVYNIYTRNSRGRWYRFRSWLLFLLMVRLPVITAVFLLNDRASVRLFNRKFKSDQFKYLPDPYAPLSENLHEQENILVEDENVITFLHFGGLTSRKGTLEILQAIKLLHANPQAPACRFVFAGKVYDDIRDDFYRSISQLSDKTEIHVFDEFCEYDFLGKLCQESDCLLIPYKQVGQSSGVLGFAAQFGIPVLAPSTGLLGKIVQDYRLGYSLFDAEPQSIANAICKYRDMFHQWQHIPNDQYLTVNCKANFCSAIGNSFTHLT